MFLLSRSEKRFWWCSIDKTKNFGNYFCRYLANLPRHLRNARFSRLVSLKTENILESALVITLQIYQDIYEMQGFPG